MVEATSLLNKVLSDTGVWIALHPPGGQSGKVLVSVAWYRVLKTILWMTIKVTAKQFMISQSGSCDWSPDPWMSGFIVPARNITLVHIQLAMAVSFNSHYFPASSCASRKRIDSHHRNYPLKQRRISQTVIQVWWRMSIQNPSFIRGFVRNTHIHSFTHILFVNSATLLWDILTKHERKIVPLRYCLLAHMHLVMGKF
jgi:hypothetical protein